MGIIYIIKIQKGWTDCDWDDWDSSYEVFEDHFFTSYDDAKQYADAHIPKGNWCKRDWFIQKLTKG